MFGSESAHQGQERRHARQILPQIQTPGEGSQRELQPERSRSRTRDEAIDDAELDHAKT